MKAAHRSAAKSTYPNLKANLVMTLLVVGVPLVTKLILQTARAASSEQIKSTQPMVVPRSGHTATVLPDGTVLIAGGTNQNGVLASAETYNPATTNFSSVGDMTAARAGHTATLLGDGRVLVAGGANESGPLKSMEIYDPTATHFLSAGEMRSARRGHTATR